MNVGVVIDAFRGANWNGLRLAARDRQLAREYWSTALRHYDELMGRGLECRDPVEFVFSAGWARRSPDDRVMMPAALNTVGGTRLDELRSEERRVGKGERSQRAPGE